jgi:zinc protease
MQKCSKSKLFKRGVVSMTVAAAFAGAAGIAAGAITPPSSSETAAANAAASKQSPPPPSAPHPMHLPKPTTYKLPNGLTVVLLEDHRVPFLTFEIGIRAGDANDPKDLPGVSAVTSDMLNEGTTLRSGKELANAIDRIGGALKASSDPDFTVVSGSALSNNSAQLLGLAAEMVEHPTFPEAEFKLEKTNLLEELKMKRSNPSFLVNERFHKVVFGNHPYAVISPTTESVEKLSRQDLINFHKTHYLPNISSLVIVGDFNVDDMRKTIEKDFGTWKSESAPTGAGTPTATQSGQTIYLVDRPGSVQSSVKIGNLGIKKNDPDYFNVMVANQILGGSPSSRLFLNIREQKGYTYGAYSSFTPHVQPGFFSASADVRTPVTGPALKEFLLEMERIRNTAVSDSELQAAKNYLIGNFQSGFETQGNVAQRLLDEQIYNLPGDYLETFTNKISAVTPDDVKRVANKYIDLNNLAIAVVGDAKQIEPQLMEFAPVEVFDVSGKSLRRDDKTAKKG